MLNRRGFLSVAAAGAGAAMFARVPKVFAASYDLIIKGGRVIDPSAGSMRSATWRSRAAASPPSKLTSRAMQQKPSTRTASWSCPGLIDIHTHRGAFTQGPGTRASPTA